MRAIPLLPLLLSGWLVLPAHADDAQDLLKRLAQAEQQQSFQGTFVYERNGSFSTHRIWHRVVDGKVREHMLQLDGSAQEVLRVDGLTQCVSGLLVSGITNQPDSPARAFDPKKLSAFYEINIVGKSRVAGRNAIIVALTPRDQHRYGIELHVDSETALPLKSLLLNDKGQLLERFQFTELDTRDIPTDQMLEATADCKPVQTASAKEDSSSVPATWRSDWVPDGFQLSRSSARQDPTSKVTLTSLMYDDGLARFSVFIEPVNATDTADIRTQLGPTVAVSRRVATASGDAMVTVVGEIPIGTAERIALSMRNADSQSKQVAK
ncbi:MULTISPECIES: MucB/RseB C-terminal domain-containing protein [unclassified Pseudomonas]|uniref:MucB/RseB C-terminal domain-containing protein n=1 Tax=unclassified Pseudomonas TaxID=196821 RepID=UPI002AC94E42|nr:MULTISPECIES: MucB/RseB C-terminal domain-containing protein [unclassified Pseudomonas]MEB0039679.1 MucB/RseB C-terminal domain-containing protein [Pseudomonas sp. MH10]MEB0075635.1 MucB/RseB C-terminal domain-containing protein [Pseudomonas sp. MH10out]MEB0099888.1 MucB/RseB C-terminal domain-containing protein [Pseudomonas sp. CCI3.2]MEB0121721.1 MucB/RseB C-terminal domain-containing protein [Pseudomonas sp. CCI1.2]MEB0133534.1 MucB/RseB C-terminal domain-containing protein [Pseudomonas 